MENLVLRQQFNLKTQVTLSSSPFSSSFKPNLRMFTTKHVNLGVSLNRNMKVKAIMNKPPLHLRSKVGRLLKGVMNNDPQRFHVATNKELSLLKHDRDSAVQQMLTNDFSVEGVIERRIAELKEEKCQIAIQDIMYLLVIFEFYEYEISLVPNISNYIHNGKIEEIPDMERKLKNIHSLEHWDAIMEHLNLINFRKRDNFEDESSQLTMTTRNSLARMYVSCILYGYFLKSVSLRYQSEKMQSLSYNDLHIGYGISLSELRISKDVFFSNKMCSSKQDKEIRDLKDYVMGFEHPKLVLDECELRSKEAFDLVENHSYALFVIDDEYDFDDFGNSFMETSFSTLKRLLMEGYAFGSFLWMAEDFIDRIYKLEKLEAE